MGDFSRDTNDPRKHYSGVLMQQGRVQLDADWNEQLAIALYRTEIEARDVIGDCGVPKKTDGFKVGLTPNALDLTISPGRIYVGGLLCELDATPVPVTFVQNAANKAAVESLYVDGLALAAGQWVEISAANKTSRKLLRVTAVNTQQHVLTFDSSVLDFQNSGAASIRRVATLLTQPDYPGAGLAGFITGAAPSGTTVSPQSPPASPPTSPLGSPPAGALKDGLYLVYVDAWKREITALDDPHVREVALGGPDTATRLKNVWQVKLLPVAPFSPPAASPPSCESQFKEWDALTAPSTGRMNARTKPPQDQKDPCLLPPTAGYTRLENQLYRVEVQRVGDRQTATFKWSRDNAVVRTTITNVSDDILTVADTGRDEVLGFAGGQWVEITDEESVLKQSPRQLAQIKGVNPATREITLKTKPAGLAGKKNLQLIRWDQFDAAAGADGVAMTAGWIDLEGGVQARFSEGTYRAGDYWLIPARTATGEIDWPPFAVPNTDPSAQPPLGVRHHFCRLALVEIKGGIINLKDCRKLFPALTEICAEDICVDNTACGLPGVENLQDMIDRLCAARDLRWHNKHLHGWGIVCGLQVECGPDPAGQKRRHVTVRPGYALDCEGNDIVLERPDSFDLLQMIADARINLTSPPKSPPTASFTAAPTSPPALADGEVCLILETDANRRRRYRLEKYEPQKDGWRSLLAGTLLMDFFNDCAKPLVDIVRDEFNPDPDEEGALVGPVRKRAITFGNLFIQYANSDNGSRVFLSGDKEAPVKDHEHEILREAYERIRAKLQSHTFCAMFEGARQFPPYPYAKTGISTIFGRGSQTRLRLHPNNKLAYTLGANHLINVYDLAKEEMVELLEFPGGSSAIVRDVAVSTDGKQLFAVATLGGKDTMFAVADISGSLKHTWRKPTVVCDVLLMTLATTSAVPERVFAVGKGKGLYEIDPKNVIATPTPRNSFNAVGHLVVNDQQGQAYATASSGTGQTDVYDRVLRLGLKGTATNPEQFTANVGGVTFTGRDDIAFVLGAPSASGAQQQKLYMVVDSAPGQSVKHVAIFNAVSNTAGFSLTNLGENTRIRLAHNPSTNHMMVTYEDSYRVRLIEPSADRLLPAYSHPVQISPLSIAVSKDAQKVYVLNFASNTLNAIPAGRFAPSNQLPIQPLVDYRAAVLEAFTDLFGGLLQYLKDCFCDHLLVNCPTCDPDDKIYLACIRIKGGEVYKVCNFSLRKYVKSFPTVEYWLSIFPVIPLVGKLVEKICCAVLPNFFGRFQAERSRGDGGGTFDPGEGGGVFDPGVNTLKGQQIETGVMFAKQTDFRAAIADTMKRVSTGGSFARETFASAITARRADAGTQAVASNEVTGLKVEEARSKLEAAGVTVDSVETYDPRKGGRNLARLALAPSRLRVGSRVTLVEQNGVVRLAEETPADVASLRTELAESRRTMAAGLESGGRTVELQKEIGALREELRDTRQKHQEALDARDREIAELRETTRETRGHAETLRVLREQVDTLMAASRRTKQEATEISAPGADDKSLKGKPDTKANRLKDEKPPK